MSNLLYDPATNNLIYDASGNLAYTTMQPWYLCDLVLMTVFGYAYDIPFFFDHTDGDERHYLVNLASTCCTLDGEKACPVGGIPIDNTQWFDTASPSREFKINTVNKTVWCNFWSFQQSITPSMDIIFSDWLSISTVLTPSSFACDGTNYRYCESCELEIHKIYSNCAHTGSPPAVAVGIGFASIQP